MVMYDKRISMNSRSRSLKACLSFCLCFKYYVFVISVPIDRYDVYLEADDELKPPSFYQYLFLY